MLRTPAFAIATITAMSISTGIPSSEAFEQGNYHLFDLVETDDAQPTDGCLAIPMTALHSNTESEDKRLVPVNQNNGFTVDFKEGFQSSGAVGFGITTPDASTEQAAPTSLDIDLLDLGGNAPKSYGE